MNVIPKADRNLHRIVSLAQMLRRFLSSFRTGEKPVLHFVRNDVFNWASSNIPQTTIEDDEVYGIAGLHTIRPSLEMKPSDAMHVLGKDVYDWIMNQYKWHNGFFGYKIGQHYFFAVPTRMNWQGQF